MATTAVIPGPTTHRIVDLDAGTTLPRAVSMGAAVLAAAGIVAALLLGAPAPERAPGPATRPVMAPQVITLPAWQVGRGDLPRGGEPTRTVGPTALIGAPATAADAVIGR